MGYGGKEMLANWRSTRNIVDSKKWTAQVYNRWCALWHSFGSVSRGSIACLDKKKRKKLKAAIGRMIFDTNEERKN